MEPTGDPHSCSDTFAKVGHQRSLHRLPRPSSGPNPRCAGEGKLAVPPHFAADIAGSLNAVLVAPKASLPINATRTPYGSGSRPKGTVSGTPSRVAARGTGSRTVRSRRGRPYGISLRIPDVMRRSSEGGSRPMPTGQPAHSATLVPPQPR